MIQSVSVANAATFPVSPAETLSDLRPLNYIFGSNGSGKTTISRVIADVTFSADCLCTWKDATPLDAYVLNRDFVEKNFGQLRGVFTLGEKQKDTEAKLAAAKEEQEADQNKLAGVNKQLVGDDGAGGKRGELLALDGEVQERFWVPVQKLKQAGKLVGALQGFMGSKQACKAKILKENASNSGTQHPLEVLENRAASVFGETPIKQASVEAPNTDALLGHEANPILKKKVIGKEDVDIAAMIRRLGNSDWVRQGLPYYASNGRACPFCQQATDASLAKNFAAYFDEAFENDSRAINTIVSRYQTDAALVQAGLAQLLAAPGKFLDVEALRAEATALGHTVRGNHLLLEKKQKEPSAIVALESLRPSLARIKRLILVARRETRKHNRLVDNLANERTALIADVWRYVLDELHVDLAQYTEKKDALDKAIAGLEANGKGLQAKVDAKVREIQEIERSLTSIQPTIDSINGVLRRFGFTSFTLARAEDGKHYKLVRQNGADARPTLSEGEKTFVVFLYFYRLLKGSTAESGTTTNRIVVFDDPISSLDSDILFIVSTLIREICTAVRAGTGNIKQVFVLTHNVYFHRQVTFDSQRGAEACRHFESFWLVRKRESVSRIERCPNNPIKSSYELLWHEVRLTRSGRQVEPNVLRRILEHYFTMLGSHGRLDDVLDKLDGPDKLIARDLLSFLHAGSHSVFDDAHISPSSSTPDSYLAVFRQVFEKTGHGPHYQMMMGPAATTAAAEPS